MNKINFRKNSADFCLVCLSMEFIRNQLPNALTCLNLLCGLSGIVLLAEGGKEAFPALCKLVFIAGAADFFDGFLARLLRSASSIGKDLDSLADAVTFGVLPGIACYFALKETGAGLWAWTGLLVPLISVIRLARFNNDPGQSLSFKGVPTPANAFFLIFLLDARFFGSGWVSRLIPDTATLSLIILASSWMLLAPFRILALKFKSYSWKANQEKYLLIITCLILTGIFGKDSAPLLYLSYIGFSLWYGFRQRKNPPFQADF